MENLNAEQIKKALECCETTSAGDCSECGYRGKTRSCFLTCTNCLISDALSLINSQEQKIKELTEENERLKGRNEHLAECLDIEDKYKDRLRGILLQFTDIVHKWGNKNGYDTSEISLVPVFYEANTIKSQIEADTVRKMHAEINSRFNADVFLTVRESNYICSVIDAIAKEMLGAANEKVR